MQPKRKAESEEAIQRKRAKQKAKRQAAKQDANFRGLTEEVMCPVTCPMAFRETTIFFSWSVTVRHGPSRSVTVNYPSPITVYRTHLIGDFSYHVLYSTVAEKEKPAHGADTKIMYNVSPVAPHTKAWTCMGLHPHPPGPPTEGSCIKGKRNGACSQNHTW